jgi:hypothetical protein
MPIPKCSILPVVGTKRKEREHEHGHIREHGGDMNVGMDMDMNMGIDKVIENTQKNVSKSLMCTP